APIGTLCLSQSSIHHVFWQSKEGQIMVQLTGEALYEQVRRAQAHDGVALNLVCAQFLHTVWAIAYAQLHNPDDADDATQNAFVLVTRFISTLRDPTRIAGWIRQLTIRSLLHERTRRRPLQLHQDEDGRLLEIPSRDGYSLLEQLVCHEERQTIVE